jgi:anti-sigma factor RsiW
MTVNFCRKCREAIMLDTLPSLPVEERLAVEQHLAHCVQCRAYGATAQSLRHLSARPVTPSADFRERWTKSVQNAARPVQPAPVVAGWLQFARWMVWRNRWTLSALTPVWGLILLFKLTAPDVAQPPPTTLARSPIEIFRAIQAETDLQFAFDRLSQQPAPAEVPALSPRSGRAPIQPMTFRPDSASNSIFLS